MSNPINDIDNLQEEPDALEQSLALNKIVMQLLDQKRQAEFWKNIIILVSIMANVLMAALFMYYNSQWEYGQTTTTTTITQDTGEGAGNNVYQSGENAEYHQEAPSEEVDMNGQTNDQSD